MKNKTTLALVIIGALALLTTAATTSVSAADWEDYEIRITVPSPGTVDLHAGETLEIEGTLTYKGEPVGFHANAVTIYSEGEVITAGTNILDGVWYAHPTWSQFMNRVGTGTHDYYAVWRGDGWGVSTHLSQGYVFNVNVVPTVQEYTLTVNVDPMGGGTISLSPPPNTPIIPPPYGGTYDEGTVVDITAHPAPGYYFDHWSGDASGTTEHLILEINSNKNITAHFTAEPTEYTLTTHVNPSGSGWVSPSGGSYEQGTVLSLSANANSGYIFDHWSGDASGTSNPVEVIMNSNKDITVNFVEEGGPGEEYTLITYVVSGQGSVSPSGTTTYPSGEEVSIRATPDSGWAFDHWEGDFSGSQNPATVIMNSDKTIGAVFVEEGPEQVTLTMTVLPPLGGVINYTLANQVTVDKGSSITLNAFPNQGYEFDYWSGDATGESPVITILMDSDKMAIAVFALEEKPIWEQPWAIVAAFAVVGLIVGLVLLARR